MYNCIEFAIRQGLVCRRNLRKSNGRKASGKRSRKDIKRQNRVGADEQVFELISGNLICSWNYNWEVVEGIYQVMYGYIRTSNIH